MDLRRAPRYSVNEPVRVCSFDARQVVAGGAIRDISDSGMRLALIGYFPTGSAVKLECDDWVVCGTVIYCFQIETNGVDTCNSIGIRIEDVRW